MSCQLLQIELLKILAWLICYTHRLLYIYMIYRVLKMTISFFICYYAFILLFDADYFSLLFPLDHKIKLKCLINSWNEETGIIKWFIIQSQGSFFKIKKAILFHTQRSKFFIFLTVSLYVHYAIFLVLPWAKCKKLGLPWTMFSTT